MASSTPVRASKGVAAVSLASAVSPASADSPAPADDLESVSLAAGNRAVLEVAMMRIKGLHSGRVVRSGRGPGRGSFRSSGPRGRPGRFLGRHVPR